MHSGLTSINPTGVLLPHSDCAAHRAWPWRRRIASAASRRIKGLWNRLAEGDRLPAVEAAHDWLTRWWGESGVASRPSGPPCPGTTAALISTLLTFGQLGTAQRLTSWLLSTQLADGSFPHAGGNTSSLFNTGQALSALLRVIDDGLVADSSAARRAAEFVNVQLHAKLEGQSYHHWRVAVKLSVLPALSAAVRHYESCEWRQTVEHNVARLRAAIDWHSWLRSGRILAHAVAALVDLQDRSRAIDALSWPNAVQRKNGTVASELRGRWGDHELLAHLAVLWYRLGERDRADRAMAFLRRQQLPGGGWPQYWGARGSGGESAWAVKHYLDAAWLQVATSFDGAVNSLPDQIDRQDGRFQAVFNWTSTLCSSPKIADVGCGPGRFLRELAGLFATARLVGIDPSGIFLEQLAPRIERRRGSLLRIPARDGEFDGAFAVESLEHSLLPERAVQEVCRIVRPGGRVLIIDKHASRQPLSLHEPWERWFTPEMVVGWLKPFCRDIQARPITHGPNHGAGLFLCWDAVRA